MTADALPTTTPPDVQRPNIWRMVMFAAITLLIWAWIFIDTFDMCASILDSPASPTVVGATEWQTCVLLGVWTLFGHLCMYMFIIVVVLVAFFGDVESIRIVLSIRVNRMVARGLLLVQGIWFVAGPFLLSRYAAKCASSAPSVLKMALDSYASFTALTVIVASLSFIAIRRSDSQAHAKIEGRQVAETVQLVTSEEKPLREDIPVVLDQDLKTEQLV